MIAARLRVNGADTILNLEPRVTLADALRDRLGLTGTHLGCEQGVCGSCTVIVDGQTARACLMFAVACNGREIWTVEGLVNAPSFASLEDTLTRHHALQCGFCTPGFVATIYEMMEEGAPPDEILVRDRLSGNLCRCTGYQNLVMATLDLLSGSAPSEVVE